MAVASKKGLFAAIGIFLLKAWKLVMAAVLGVGYWLRKRMGGKQDSAEP